MADAFHGPDHVSSSPREREPFGAVAHRPSPGATTSVLFDEARYPGMMLDHSSTATLATTNGLDEHQRLVGDEAAAAHGVPVDGAAAEYESFRPTHGHPSSGGFAWLSADRWFSAYTALPTSRHGGGGGGYGGGRGGSDRRGPWAHPWARWLGSHLFTILATVSFCWILWLCVPLSKINKLNKMFDYEVGCKLSMENGVLHTRGLDAPVTWQPQKCFMHQFNAKQVGACYAKAPVVFWGDSTVRQLYKQFITTLDPSQAKVELEKHADHHVTLLDVEAQFYWDPYLNRTDMMSFLNRKTPLPTKPVSGQKPKLFVLGTGLHYMRYIPDPTAAKAAFLKTMDEVIALVKNGPGGYMSDNPIVRYLDPVIPERLTPERRETLLPQQIYEWNTALYHRIGRAHDNYEPSLELGQWNLYAQAAQTGMSADGMHYAPGVVNAELQMIITNQCVAQINNRTPPVATCCVKLDTPKERTYWHLSLWLWLGCMLSMLHAVPVLIKRLPSRVVEGLMRSQPRLGRVLGRGVHIVDRFLPSGTTAWYMFLWGGMLIWVYFADRSALSYRVNKPVDPRLFWSLIAVILAAGLLTVERHGPKNKPPSVATTGFLNRYLTDEWKGWMQLMILAYHYTGGSKMPYVYNAIRCMVAAYLFMTGYGHFMYFFKKKDYSMGRVLRTLLRLNLLTLQLSFLMTQNSLFYYFGPLTSFWFLFVYVTMRIRSSANASHSAMPLLFKIVLATIAVAMGITFPGILELLFGVVNRMFNTQWDASESRFRLALDLWIVPVGMVTAFVVTRLQTRLAHADATYATDGSWPRLMRRGILAAIATVGGFVVVNLTFFSNKFAYNQWHALLSPLIVVAYVILRNATPGARASSSRFYGWIGRMSLETFILQYHIWLAMDTRGLLVIYPARGGPDVFSQSRASGHFSLLNNGALFLNFVAVTLTFLAWSASATTMTNHFVAALMPTPAPTVSKDKPASARLVEAKTIDAKEHAEGKLAEMVPLQGVAGHENGQNASPSSAETGEHAIFGYLRVMVGMLAVLYYARA